MAARLRLWAMNFGCRQQIYKCHWVEIRWGGDRLNGCTFDTLLNCKSIVPNTNGYGRPLKEYMAKLITYGSVLVSLMQITLYYI